LAELGAFLLPAVPFLALVVCLLLGRYPGCDAIVRLSERIASRDRPKRMAEAQPRLPMPPRSFAPGGGLLIALGIAQRPPPPSA
jgi:hypothetical protein